MRFPARGTETVGAPMVESYPGSYATDDDVVANLRFALRYEALNLGVLAAVFAAMPADIIADWARA